MTQLIAQYRTREAIVSIVKSDGGFRVQMDRLTVRGGSEHRAYPIEELDSAVVRAQAIVSKISGYSIEEKQNLRCYIFRDMIKIPCGK